MHKRVIRLDFVVSGLSYTLRRPQEIRESRMVSIRARNNLLRPAFGAGETKKMVGLSFKEHQRTFKLILYAYQSYNLQLRLSVSFLA